VVVPVPSLVAQETVSRRFFFSSAALFLSRTCLLYPNAQHSTGQKRPCRSPVIWKFTNNQSCSRRGASAAATVCDSDHVVVGCTTPQPERHSCLAVSSAIEALSPSS
jgi:hypothetical protein